MDESFGVPAYRTPGLSTPGLDALKDEELEELAWKAMDAHQGGTQSRKTSQKGQRSTGAEQTFMPSAAVTILASPALMQMSPNVEVRKKRSPRKTVVVAPPSPKEQLLPMSESPADGSSGSQPRKAKSHAHDSRQQIAPGASRSGEPATSRLPKRKTLATAPVVVDVEEQPESALVVPQKESREDRRRRMGLQSRDTTSGTSTSETGVGLAPPSPKEGPTHFAPFAPSPLRHQASLSPTKRRLTSLLDFSPSKGKNLGRSFADESEEMERSSELLKLLGKSPSPKQQRRSSQSQRTSSFTRRRSEESSLLLHIEDSTSQRWTMDSDSTVLQESSVLPAAEASSPTPMMVETESRDIEHAREGALDLTTPARNAMLLASIEEEEEYSRTEQLKCDDEELPAHTPAPADPQSPVRRSPRRQSAADTEQRPSHPTGDHDPGQWPQAEPSAETRQVSFSDNLSATRGSSGPINSEEISQPCDAGARSSERRVRTVPYDSQAKPSVVSLASAQASPQQPLQRPSPAKARTGRATAASVKSARQPDARGAAAAAAAGRGSVLSPRPKSQGLKAKESHVLAAAKDAQMRGRVAQGTSSSSRDLRPSLAPSGSKPQVTRVSSPAKAKTNAPRIASPVKPPVASPVKARVASPAKAQDTSPAKARTAAPVESQDALPVEPKIAPRPRTVSHKATQAGGPSDVFTHNDTQVRDKRPPVETKPKQEKQQRALKTSIATDGAQSSSSRVDTRAADVPEGFRLSSTGSLVAVARPQPRSTATGSSEQPFAPSAQHLAKLLAAAEEAERLRRSRVEYKAHDVPAYLERRRLELKMEEEQQLQRQIEAVRAKELGQPAAGEGAGEAANRRRTIPATSRSAVLAPALMGRPPATSHAAVAKVPERSDTRSGPAAGSSKPAPRPFVSATSTRLAERAAWENKRAARDALLEAERAAARAERERREEEELKKERARRIPKANPVPREIYGTSGIVTVRKTRESSRTQSGRHP
ncbi:unnamed protein product [Parajaminaea phylloscopi]